jgi:hypothetical protein
VPLARGNKAAAIRARKKKHATHTLSVHISFQIEKTMINSRYMEIFLDIEAVSQENKGVEDGAKNTPFLQPSPGRSGPSA